MNHNTLTHLLTPPARWALGLTLLLLVAGLLPSIQFFSVQEHYLPLHSFLEFLSMAVSAMVAALVWNLRNREGNHNRILLGAGFLAVTLIDFAHTQSYAGMPAFVTASGPEKAINFWLMGRLVAALTLLSFALLPNRQCPPRPTAACLLRRSCWPWALWALNWNNPTGCPAPSFPARA
jgi:hypothetical protein